jgi:hypothetical protein
MAKKTASTNSEVSSTANFVQETPTGNIDGVNTTFTLSQTPTANSGVSLFLNGNLVTQGAGADEY